MLSTPQDDNGTKASMILQCNPKFQQVLKHLFIFTVDMTLPSITKQSMIFKIRYNHNTCMKRNRIRF